jgi:Mg-chelatase subunit ChlD
MMRFTDPQFLLLVPALVWFWKAGGGKRLARRRTLRVTAALCLIVAMSGPQARSGDSPLSVMLALDRSASMAGDVAESLRSLATLTAGMRADDRAGLVTFASTPMVERPLSTQFDPPSLGSASVGTMTNLEAALRLARSTMPADGSRRIVLMSDGRETQGDALAEAARAAMSAVAIDVVIPDSRQPPPIEVLRVTAPPAARRTEPFAVAVIATGEPGASGTITLTSTDDSTRVAAVTLSSDGYATVPFSVQAQVPGVHIFEATAESPQDRSDFGIEPRRSGAVVLVEGETEVLYVGASPELLAPLTSSRSGFRVHSIAPAHLPRSAAALARYDAIVLDDVRTDQIDLAQAGALRAHVEQEGGGVLFLGSRESLEAGLLADHTLGEMLPIDVRPRGGQRAASLGLVVAFDKSGSMGDRVDGVPRIEFARMAVRRVFDAVPVTDAVGVIAFDAAPHVVAPLRAGHDTRAMVEGLDSVQPSGATAIAPAVELATQWLRGASALAQRHVLLVSDGRTTAEDAARLRASVRNGGIELSVVALGADADRELLESLARLSGGRAYFPNDIRELPAVVARESARVAGGRVVDTPFEPIVRAHPMLSGVITNALPQLGGYVVAAAKPSAESPVVSSLGDPILATWRFGLGRVAAYTAELHAPWSARLRSWAGFGPFVIRVSRWVARTMRDTSLYARFEDTADGLRLVVEAANDGTPISDLQCRATVRTPSGETSSLTLEGTAPGRYEAPLKASGPGAYVVAISAANRGGNVDRRIVRGWYWSADLENRDRAPNLALLRRIAEATGGRVMRPGESAFSAPRQPSYVDTWRWLAFAALIMFLADILLPAIPTTLSRWRKRPDPDPHAHEAAA